MDLDGVVYDFVESLRQYLINELGYTREELPKHTSWNFYKDDWGQTLDWYLQHTADGVDAGYVFLHGKPELGAREYIRMLREDGHTIHLCTNRHFGTKSVSNTEEWLKREGIEYDSLTISRDKTVIDVDVFLDDFIDNYDALIAAGTHAVMFTQPWNKNHNAKRVGDWVEFYAHVCGLVDKLPPSYQTGLQEAQGLVYGNRNKDYGHPAEDFTRTAKMWEAILDTDVTAKQAALCMAAVKISREMNAPKRDNLVDLAGYAEVALRIQRFEDGEEPN